MSKLIAVRLQDELLAQVDRERKRTGLTRAAAINQALQLWVEKRQYLEAVRRDHEGYDRHPVREDEFAPILGAQTWPI
jgi:metal-responsive CopG/Arc/MetJ family transcriptional regulator